MKHDITPGSGPRLSRRRLVLSAGALASAAAATGLLAACGASTAAPTQAPAAAATKPAAGAPTTAPATAPTQAPAAAAPTQAPAAAAQPSAAATQPAAAAKPTEAPKASSAPSGAATTITFISTLTEPARIDGQKATIADFEKSQSNVKVDFQNLSWGDAPAKFTAMVAAGSPPDTSTGGNTWPLTYANQGAIREADTVLGTIGGTASFYPSELVAYTFKGKVWGLPFYQTPDLLMYRKDWFDEKGIKAPDLDKDYSFTWDTFLETATKLTGNGIYGLTEPLADNHGYKPFWGLLLTNGGSVLDKDNKLAYNNPETIETYEYMAKLYKAAAPPGIATYQVSDSSTAMKSSKAAMTMWNTGLLRETKLDQPDLLAKLGCIGIPTKKGKGGFKGGVNFMLYKTKKEDAVQAFYQFLYKKENYIKLLLCYPELMLPSRPEATEAQEYVNAKEFEPTKTQMVAARKVLPDEYGLTLRWGPNPWGGEIEAKKVLQQPLIEMLTSGVSAADAVKKTEKVLNDIMSA